ncbi:NAD-dependent epimerase/dehydratase family protein [Methylocystis parvus]|uniref:NAD-dependent epimerase/dehydratase family protein n=1 Tax=Methylocystis parvus TaxID=134 RepID=UPI0002F2DAED|nr:NAD-dependent epimerase/dehydratase family protein [Methylocystis parvus]WBJ98987.1 SDR family oxidoreductase [Methylocystis parvus OBBP]
MARVLVIGGTGYLGSLIGATLLEKTQDFVVLAARPGHQRDDIVARLRMEMTAAGDPDGAALERLRIVRLPAPGDSRGFSSLFRENRIDEVINCAGAVHYFDVEALQASTIDLVNDLLRASKEARINRFIHVSTAFACGFSLEPSVEALLPEPPADPTPYTRFKRRSEYLVAESGLPFIILRPSIVIGDSRDGHYFGPDYGVYQYWESFAKVMMDRYRDTIHVVASDHSLPLVHQDAFVSTLLAVRARGACGAFVNVVSPEEQLPSVKALWRQYCDLVVRPHRLFCYDSIEEAPVRELDTRHRAFLNITAINSRISSWGWRFDTTHRDRLIEEGLVFPPVTLQSVRKCQSRFVASSPATRDYLQKFEQLFPDAPKQPRARALADALAEGPGGSWLL